MSQEQILQENSRPINPTKRPCDDPVMDVYRAAASLEMLAEAMEREGRHTESAILTMLQRQVQSVADRFDIDDTAGVQQ
jgi:ribose 1,5-bisphosphokinase PhnN